MRPRGKPPMPSAMSRPSEPVEITSLSVAASREPSFMIEPLPNARSIWPSAASRAFCLSTVSLSNRRNAVADISRTPLISQGPQGCNEGQCTCFVLKVQVFVLFLRKNPPPLPPPLCGGGRDVTSERLGEEVAHHPVGFK